MLQARSCNVQQSDCGPSERHSVEFRPWSADDFRLQIPSNVWMQQQDGYNDGHADGQYHAGSEQVQEFEEFNARFASMAENATGCPNGSVEGEAKSEADVPSNQSQADGMQYEPSVSCFQNTTTYSTPLSSPSLVYTSGGVSCPVSAYRTADGVVMSTSFATNCASGMQPESCSWNSANFTRHTNNPISKAISASRTQLKQELMRQQTLQQEGLQTRQDQQKCHEAFLLQRHTQNQQYPYQQQLNPHNSFPCSNNAPITINSQPSSPSSKQVEVKSRLENPTDFHMVESCKRNTSRRPLNHSSGTVVSQASGASAPPPGRLYSIPESKMISKEGGWVASEPGCIFIPGHHPRLENTRLAQQRRSPLCTNIPRGYKASRPLLSQELPVSSPSINISTCVTPPVSGGTLVPVTSSFASSGVPSVANSVSSNRAEVDDVLLQELINFERDENSSQATNNNNNHGNHVSDSFSELLTFDGSTTSVGRPQSSPEIPHIKNEPVSSNEPHYHECFVKDRKKKDTHNKIERSRRSHINDMIYELKDLLPQPGEAFFEKMYTKRQYKGHILSATVEYIKLMKGDLNALVNTGVQKAALEIKNKQLEQRLQKLESCLNSNGIAFDKPAVVQPQILPHVIHSDVISSTTSANASYSAVPSFGHNNQLELPPTIEKNIPPCEIPPAPADSTVGNGILIPAMFNSPTVDFDQFDFLQGYKMLPETSHMEDLMLNHFDPTIESFFRGLNVAGKEDCNIPPLDNGFEEDFFSNYTAFDLMEDDTESYCNDVMLSSPQLSSPNSSRHSLQDSLPPLQPMDIVS